MTMEFNTFYNEDCLETMKKMEPNSIHCVITSPPYNMTKRKGGYADKQPRYDEYQEDKIKIKRRTNIYIILLLN